MSYSPMVIERKNGRLTYRHKQTVGTWIFRLVIGGHCALGVGLVLELVVRTLLVVLFPPSKTWGHGDIVFEVLQFLFFHVLAWVLLRRSIRDFVLKVG